MCIYVPLHLQPGVGKLQGNLPYFPPPFAVGFPQDPWAAEEEGREGESRSNPRCLPWAVLPVSGEMDLPRLLLGSGGTAAPARLPFEVLFRFMISFSKGLKVVPFQEER